MLFDFVTISTSECVESFLIFQTRNIVTFIHFTAHDPMYARVIHDHEPRKELMFPPMKSYLLRASQFGIEHYFVI